MKALGALGLACTTYFGGFQSVARQCTRQVMIASKHILNACTGCYLLL